MRLRRVGLADGAVSVAVWDEARDRWIPLRRALDLTGRAKSVLAPVAEDLVGFLSAGEPAREAARRLCDSVSGEDFTRAMDPAPLLPFWPTSIRCHMSWEQHWTQAARGLVRRYLPRVFPLVQAYEGITRSVFPPLRPGRLFRRRPDSYLGNHLNVHTEGQILPWPGYCRDLDVELELGAVVCHPVLDATAAEGEAAIGGFFVFNDLSARDTQWTEHRHGLFGPIGKAKTFANAMGADVVTADEVLPHIDGLEGGIRVNDELWSRTSTAGMRYSFGELLAHASDGEPVHPGEVLTSGTLPNGCGLELDRWLRPGDRAELWIDRIGALRNLIGVPRKGAA